MKTRTFYCEESENGVSLSVVQLIKIKFYGSGEKREQGLFADAPNGDSLRSGDFFATRVFPANTLVQLLNKPVCAELAVRLAVRDPIDGRLRHA
jgi:hypothetical protein